MFRFLLMLFSISTLGCNQDLENSTTNATENEQEAISSKTNVITLDSTNHQLLPSTKGALLLTRFKTMEELKQVVQIEYFEGIPGADPMMHKTPFVRLRHIGQGREVISLLRFGVSQSDLYKAWAGGIWDKVWLGLNVPYLILHKRNLPRLYTLSRRKYGLYGEGDMAFYDLAETMLHKISNEYLAVLPSEDLSEKGYLNTFNHVVSQAFMTSIFSEQFADFIADTHERAHMPELITGQFTTEQLQDLERGPIDNYVDIINNEWGQELGKDLRKKYGINQQTHWTPKLLANYLNDLQQYFSWSFQIGFEPFRTEDEVVVTFAKKINTVMADMSDMRWKKREKK